MIRLVDPFPKAEMKTDLYWAGIAALCLAAAQCRADTGWYGGIASGITRHAESEAFASGFTTARDDADIRSTAAKLLLGRRMTPHLSMELAYVDYGKLTREVAGAYGAFHVGARGARYTFERHQKGFVLDVVAEYPAASQVTVHAGIGAAAMRVNTRFVAVAEEVSYSPRSETSGNVRGGDTALHAMLGIGWTPVKEWAVRLGIERVGRVGSKQSLTPPTSGETATTSVMFSVVRRF